MCLSVPQTSPPHPGERHAVASTLLGDQAVLADPSGHHHVERLGQIVGSGCNARCSAQNASATVVPVTGQVSRSLCRCVLTADRRYILVDSNPEAVRVMAERLGGTARRWRSLVGIGDQLRQNTDAARSQLHLGRLEPGGGAGHGREAGGYGAEVAGGSR